MERARETIKDVAEYINKSADDAMKLAVIRQAKVKLDIIGYAYRIFSK